MNHTNLHPMRRPDRAASEDFARRTANEAPYGTLVTASASGEPYGTPVSPVIEDDKIYFHAAAGAGRKFENLTANPRCSMVFVSMTEPDEPAFSMNYRSAVFEGRATLVTDEIEKMHALWLIGARRAGCEEACLHRGRHGPLRRLAHRRQRHLREDPRDEALNRAFSQNFGNASAASKCTGMPVVG